MLFTYFFFFFPVTAESQSWLYYFSSELFMYFQHLTFKIRLINNLCMLKNKTHTIVIGVLLEKSPPRELPWLGSYIQHDNKLHSITIIYQRYIFTVKHFANYQIYYLSLDMNVKYNLFINTWLLLINNLLQVICHPGPEPSCYYYTVYIGAYVKILQPTYKQLPSFNNPLIKLCINVCVSHTKLKLSIRFTKVSVRLISLYSCMFVDE